MVPDKRLQHLIESKDHKAALRSVRESHYIEAWAIVDGCLVVYDAQDAPKWLTDKLIERDEDGNTPAFYDKNLRESLEAREAA